MPVNILQHYFKMRGSVVTLISVTFGGCPFFFGQPPLDYYFLFSVFIIASCIRWEITRYGA